MVMRITKEELMMQIAELIATRSTCSRFSVGSLLTDKNLINIKSYGYNGNYAGGPNACDSEEVGNCGCIHSEVNCLIKAFNKHEDDVFFVTLAPCYNCAKLIINSGIKTVYYRTEYRKADGINLLRSAGVTVYNL